MTSHVLKPNGSKQTRVDSQPWRISVCYQWWISYSSNWCCKEPKCSNGLYPDQERSCSQGMCKRLTIRPRTLDWGEAWTEKPHVSACVYHKLSRLLYVLLHVHSEPLLGKIHIIQNCCPAAKIIYHTVISANSIHWLPRREKIKYKIPLFTYKAPAYPSNPIKIWGKARLYTQSKKTMAFNLLRKCRWASYGESVLYITAPPYLWGPPQKISNRLRTWVIQFHSEINTLRKSHAHSLIWRNHQ